MSKIQYECTVMVTIDPAKQGPRFTLPKTVSEEYIREEMQDLLCEFDHDCVELELVKVCKVK